MNILIDKLPDDEFVDFRLWVQFELWLNDEKLLDDEKQAVIKLLFKGEYSFEELLSFYIEGISSAYPSQKGSCDRVYCFDMDADAIYSAFWRVYGIRLQSAKMHWFEFMSLFRGLFIKIEDIASYRGYDGSDKHYRNLKGKWALKEVTHKDRETLEIEAILRSDGDFSKLRRR